MYGVNRKSALFRCANEAIWVMQKLKERLNRIWQPVYNFCRDYIFVIGAVVVYVGAAFAIHRMSFLEKLLAFLKNPEWWAENTYSVIVFAVLGGVILNKSADRRAKREREPYEGWTVHIDDGKSDLKDVQKEKVPEDDGLKLYWEEVRTYLQSPMEERRMIQSIVSALGKRVETGELDLTKVEWVKRIDNKKRYKIMIHKIPERNDTKSQGAS